MCIGSDFGESDWDSVCDVRETSMEYSPGPHLRKGDGLMAGERRGAILMFLVVGIAAFTGCENEQRSDRGTLNGPENESSTVQTVSLSGVDSSNQEVFTNSIGMKFVRISGGRFMMGTPDTTTGQEDEQPQHQVLLTYGFSIGVYEVRQKEFRKIMGRNPSSFSADGKLADKVSGRDTDNSPVESVNWVDAVEFCRRLSRRPEERQRGRLYRLPTEAEWEFCCRAGTTTRFSVGSTLGPDAACFQPSSDSDSTDRQSPDRVGNFAANPFGLYDMHGNVWEWCLDRFRGDYYRHSPAVNPSGPRSGDTRVIRGGGWNVKAIPFCRSAFRDGLPEESRENYVGFRLVCISGVFDLDSGLLIADSALQESPNQNGSIAQIIKSAEPSVVRISATGPSGRHTGSGCLVFDNLTVITNYHVIEQATAASVEFPDGMKVEVTGTVALAPDKDLALLRLRRRHGSTQPLKLAVELPRKGERVITFGAPLGLSFSTSDGIVSSIREPEELERLGFPFGKTVTWIQTTAPISPGNSGGPLVNSKGQVVGINTLVVQGRDNEAQNLNFAVSARNVSDLRKVLSDRPEGLMNHGSEVNEALERLKEFLNQNNDKR